MDKFDTKLSPEEERRFQRWKAVNAPEDSGEDYDLRGAFQAAVRPDARGHWPDTFKKPNHPTFSVESKYAKYGKPGHWEGETFVPAESKPSRSKEVLGSKKNEAETPTLRELRRMSLERTTNGHIKATHQYSEGPEEVHALPQAGFLGHLKSAFNLSEEKRAIDAKRQNVEDYEKATRPAAPAAAAPDAYDKIRADVRAKAAQPAAPLSELLGRADALLIKGR